MSPHEVRSQDLPAETVRRQKTLSDSRCACRFEPVTSRTYVGNIRLELNSSVRVISE